MKIKAYLKNLPYMEKELVKVIEDYLNIIPGLTVDEDFERVSSTED